MKRFKKMMMLFALVLVLTPVSVSAAVFKPETKSSAALLIDLNTGRVLADKNSNERLPLGSVSKLLLAYFIEEAVADGKLSWDQKIEIKPKFVEYSHDLSVATVPLYSEGEYTVRDLMNATLIPSSNSATMVLADLIAGDQEKYNQMANEKLASWGIKNANWSSASGLPVGALGPFQTDAYDEDEMNRLSAREAATITGHLLQDYPHVLTFTKKVTTPFPDGKGGSVLLQNTNKLLQDPDYDVEGMKTGTILEYGNNLVAKTKIHGVPVLSVILNAKLAESTTESFTSSKNMWNQASKALVAEIVPKGMALGEVKEKTANTRAVKVGMADEQKYLLGKKEDKPSFTDVKLNSEAPFAAGQKVGTATWDFAGEPDFFLPDAGSVAVQATENTDEANWFVRTWRAIFN